MTKVLLLVALACSVGRAEGSDISQHEPMYGFLAGTYIAVGRDYHTGETYDGKVVLSAREGHLAVTRTVGGETVTGVGTIEHSLGPDQAHVLRVRFERGGQSVEITYLWGSDLDNYARLTGYVYQPGLRTASPGLEALFSDPMAR